MTIAYFGYGNACTYLSDSQGISKPGIVWLAHVPALADKYSLGIQSFSDIECVIIQ
jgi:hypothetical protein